MRTDMTKAIRPDPISENLFGTHLTSISKLSDAQLFYLLDLSQYYSRLSATNEPIPRRLAGKTQVNLFLENSTRTNVSFELAGKKLGADILVLPVAASSVHKGEELRDTSQTLAAMGADAMIVRNKEHDTSSFIAEAFNQTKISCSVINAGEGTQSHPTQALLDALTILNSLGRKASKGLEGITIAICGDISHSRVAGSNIELLPRLGAELRLVGPENFLPSESIHPEIHRYTDLHECINGCQFVMALRVQKERINSDLAFSETDFHQSFGLDYETLKYAAEDAKVMHPGPMNRGIEIDGTLADDRDRSLILDQVTNGVITRMAVLDALLTNES